METAAALSNAILIGKWVMTSVRMDKWLWAARFFKTRALASRACVLGRIQSNGQAAKSARDVRIGDMLRVTNDGGEFEIEVLLLSDVRGPASIAQTLYRETESSRELRLKVAAERKAMKQFEQLPAGKPSKRDRRRIIQFRGRVWPEAAEVPEARLGKMNKKVEEFDNRNYFELLRRWIARKVISRAGLRVRRFQEKNSST
jgi:ribosome-associated heat shock protein Hsp15